ncbi:methyltransferase domain-containing protein [Mycolicibacterium sp. S2-37]|uniref:class I SAM-dependent methyltransferase n=1 Tax=Mycolicibacterium sp. S2-37 TaxID=2810297 RepID=UPI001A943195|nr:class I SAM-dependent methyltransferase [Mycolicibacterium sp. S2-37]MBO0678119.1 methyltransferase domain-containing protein [Mycolicibacterium sp. S2-37]
MPADYWNHNTAYHPWLVDIGRRHHGDVLDVGCGDGLLAARLSPVSRSVTALDPDPGAVQRARDRLSGYDAVTVTHAGFLTFDPGTLRFDLITFVASLHHMPLRPALLRARELLRPGGELAVVGLSANKTIGDLVWAAGCLPLVRIGSRWHHEVADVGLVMTDPRESLREIRAVAAEVLPGASVRRALYYRYLLRWKFVASN